MIVEKTCKRGGPLLRRCGACTTLQWLSVYRLYWLTLLFSQSVVTLDVKPWDDETDMAELERSVRSIEKDGLVWGSSKLVAIGYGVKKLQITLVIEDEKISLDDLQDEVGLRIFTPSSRL